MNDISLFIEFKEDLKRHEHPVSKMLSAIPGVACVSMFGGYSDQFMCVINGQQGLTNLTNMVLRFARRDIHIGLNIRHNTITGDMFGIHEPRYFYYEVVLTRAHQIARFSEELQEYLKCFP